MPWSPERFPASMRRLPLPVRLKAIEIANALLAEGMDEGRAIRIGIAKAKEWATRHGTDLLQEGGAGRPAPQASVKRTRM